MDDFLDFIQRLNGAQYMQREVAPDETVEGESVLLSHPRSLTLAAGIWSAAARQDPDGYILSLRWRSRGGELFGRTSMMVSETLARHARPGADPFARAWAQLERRILATLEG